MEKENSSYKPFSADRAIYGHAQVCGCAVIYKVRFYFVEYNAVYIARYKTIKSCLNFIKRKNLKNDCNNVLRIWDNDGALYDTTNGQPIDVSDEV